MSPIDPLSPRQVNRVADRSTFLYLEHCTLGRDGGAVTATTQDGIVHIPIAALSTLLLGPGTRITHQAVTAIADSGCAVAWVGEQGTRFYAAGVGLNSSDALARSQARLVSNSRSRLEVVRKMYSLRFPGEDVDGLSAQQLRGREGTRIRRLYRSLATVYGVEWSGREYDPTNFDASTPINQALSTTAASLYGLCHAVIVSLGCSPALGFLHTGHARSFVFDVTDLYKAETSIPVAFEVVSLYQSGNATKSSVTATARHAMRDKFQELRLAERIVADLKDLLQCPQENAGIDVDGERRIRLWDGGDSSVLGGVLYGDFGSEDDAG